MSVNIGSISSKLKSLSSGGGGLAGQLEVNRLSSRVGFLGTSNYNQPGDPGYFQALQGLSDSDAGLATALGAITILPEIVQGKAQFKNDEPVTNKQTELNALEGHKDEAGEAKPDPNLEVITGASPEAMNYAMTLLTADDLNKNLKILKQHLAIPEGFQGETKQSIEDADEKLIQPKGEGQYKEYNMGKIGGVLGDRQGSPNAGGSFGLGNLKTALGQLSKGAKIIESLINSTQSQREGVAPNLSDKMIDDMILSLDPYVINLLNTLLGFNLSNEQDKIQILSYIATGELEAAAQKILDLTNRTDIDKSYVVEQLETIKLDADEIVDTDEADNPEDIDLSKDNEGASVDSAEEFEADLATSPQPIHGMILHTTNLADPRSIIGTSQMEKIFGKIFHYIVKADGRVYRSAPLSSRSGLKGAIGALHILFMKANDNNNNPLSIQQARSFDSMLGAAQRIVPGLKVANYSQISGSNSTPSVGVSPQRLPSGRTGANDSGIGSSGNYNPGLEDGATATTPAGKVTPTQKGKLKHKLDSRCGPVNGILAAAGDATGIRVVTGSGYRGNTGSKRHNGRASDVFMFLNGNRLSLLNASERPYIIAFADACYKYGAKGIGAANHAKNNSKYMSGTKIHVDVVGNRRGGIDFWGNGQTKWSGNAPKWLWQLARKHGYRG